MIYKFSDMDARRFATQFGYKVSKSGHNLVFNKCPYCGNNTDKKNKFAIDLNTGMFNCFRASCSAKGNMITLSRDFGFSLGREVDAYYSTVDYSSKQYKQFKDKHRTIESKPAAIEYLTDRGIPEEVIKKYEITSRNDDDSIIVFPFKDERGDLTFIKYRNTDPKDGQSKEWCEKNCKPILFGMNHCDVSISDSIIITEGQIDSLSVVTAGYNNVCSVPTGKNGFTWMPYCYNFLKQFKQIIIMGDCENGIITLADEISKRFPQVTKVAQQADYLGCKDANEILKKNGVIAIRNAIENSKAAYDSHIKPLSKVKQVDIMKMDTISTGMTAVDRVLDGGFRFGQLAVLSGKRGNGKSTLASMFGVEAIYQKVNSFFYSGELPDFYFRNWMDCQVTGKKEHSQSENDMLDVWYGDRAFLYDNNLIKGDEYMSIIEIIEVAILQYNCRFIMIDNLMTAMDDDLESDLYRSQSVFVGNLANLAKKHNVFILLIAHPKKTQLESIENDDISGSSHITDKADIVFSYCKDNDAKSLDEKKLIITKNRLTGRLAVNEKAIKLVYDPESRRIGDSLEACKRIDFNWNTNPYNDGFIDVDNLDEIPFDV